MRKLKLKKKIGRPTKFNEETAEIIVSALRAGNYLETAAALAGIRQDALRDWVRDGARGKTPELAAFSLAVKDAMADAEADMLNVITRAALGYEVVEEKVVYGPTGTIVERVKKRSQKFDWTAAAWRLERKHPDRWAKTIRTEATETDDAQKKAEAARNYLKEMLAGLEDAGETK